MVHSLRCRHARHPGVASIDRASFRLWWEVTQALFLLTATASVALILSAVTAGILARAFRRKWLWFLIPIFAVGWFAAILVQLSSVKKTLWSLTCQASSLKILGAEYNHFDSTESTVFSNKGFFSVPDTFAFPPPLASPNALTAGLRQ